MALYRLHKTEWEKQLRPATEAYKIKTGKRKRDNATEEDGETNGGRRPKEFPGGGKKGVSTGLGKIVRKNGVRIDHRTGRVLEGKDKGRVGGEAGAGGGSAPATAGNWWEDDA